MLCYVVVGLLHFRLGLLACLLARMPLFLRLFPPPILSIPGLDGQRRTGYKKVAFYFLSGNDSYDKTRYNDDDDGRGAGGLWHGRVG